MIKLLKNSLLLRNYSYLSFVHILNLVLPLILIPYLIRVLKPNNYGLIVYAQSIVSYLVIVVNFGYNFSATRNISKNRKDLKKIDEIASSVFIIKLILFLISAVVLSLILIIVNTKKELFLLTFFTLHMCVAELIFPIWFFQGLEKMKPISISSFISKLIYVALVFFFVKHESDYYMVPLFNLAGVTIGGSYIMFLIIHKYKVKLYIPETKILLFYLRDSYAMFLSKLSSQIYVYASKFLVGTFIGMNEVAYYDIAEKITRVIKLPQYILNQVLFPKFSISITTSLYKKMKILSLLFAVACVILVFYFTDPLIALVGGESTDLARNVLRILVISVIPVYIVSYYATLLLIPLGHEKIWTRITIYSCFVYGIGFLILYIAQIVNVYSVALLTVLIEFFVLLSSHYYCRKLNILIS